MSFTDWLIIGGVGLLLRSGLEKAAADRAEQEQEYASMLADIREHEKEWNRRNQVKIYRKGTPCNFNDGISYEEFIAIAKKCGKKLKRIKNVEVDGALVTCTVESQTGYSEWEFNVDFNDWGHITGTYWPQADNADSSVPKHFGQMMSGLIHDALNMQGIELEDLSDFVDENDDLGTDNALSYHSKIGFTKKLLKKVNTVCIGFNSVSLLGEHIYPVISILKSRGFKNIESEVIRDIDRNSKAYPFQIAQIKVGDNYRFDSQDSYLEDCEIVLTYHDKKKIAIPMSQSKMKNKNYTLIGDELQALGFCEIYEHPIYDLKTGWIVKDCSIDKVAIEGTESFSKGELFEYDTRIVIYYHTLSKNKKK